MTTLERGTLQVSEFCMLVNGPFATDIYVDLGQLGEEEASKEDFTAQDIEILKSIQDRPKSANKITKQVKPDREISTLLDNLKKRKLVDQVERAQKKLFFHEDAYVATFEGQKKLKNWTFSEFIKAMKKASSNNDQVEDVEDGRKSYEEQFKSILRLEERARALAKIILKDSSFSCSDLGADLKFKNNTVHLFETGVGIFSTKVTVKFQDGKVNVADIREKLEERVKEEINNKFGRGILEKILETFSKVAGSKESGVKLIRSNRKLDRSKVANYVWLHTIYWLYGDMFLLDYQKGANEVSHSEMQKAFTDLLDQDLGNDQNFLNHYVYYGWGRSLILTRENNEHENVFVNKKAYLVEIGQYFCFGLNLLDYFLTKKISELMTSEPVIEHRHKYLELNIQDFNRIRSSTLGYLEHFRSGINVVLQSGQLSLFNRLENQWRLKQLERDIGNKLRSIENELYSKEQSLTREKQDRLNKVVVIFTILSIIVVVVHVAGLTPLKDKFSQKDVVFPFSLLFSTQLSFVLTVTIIVVGFIVYVVLKYPKTHQV